MSSMSSITLAQPRSHNKPALPKSERAKAATELAAEMGLEPILGASPFFSVRCPQCQDIITIEAVVIESGRRLRICLTCHYWWSQ